MLKKSHYKTRATPQFLSLFTLLEIIRQGNVLARLKEHLNVQTHKSRTHSNNQKPNWVPIAIKFQACFHICCFTPSSPDHLLPGLPILFSQPGYLANGIKEAERWLKKPIFFLHYFTSGSVPSTAWPHRFYHRMDAVNCAGQRKRSQIKGTD